MLSKTIIREVDMKQFAYRNKRTINFFIHLVIILFAFTSTYSAWAGENKSNPSKQKKRYYEIMWAADPAFCEKVRSYADREHADYMPTNINFGNVKWVELDHPSREATNVIFAGKKNFKTAFRWILPRSMGQEWDYTLDVFPALINFADLAKDPASFARKQEWTFEPDDVELTGLNGKKSQKPSKWCAKLKYPDRPELGCKGKHPVWRFSFFDLIEVDGKTYITASTEQYGTEEDKYLPVVILVGRYIVPSSDTPRFVHGNNGTMSQLEHRCYLIKTD